MGTGARNRADGKTDERVSLERDDFSSNRHPAPTFCRRMIFSENRYPLFGIMRYSIFNPAACAAAR